LYVYLFTGKDGIYIYAVGHRLFFYFDTGMWIIFAASTISLLKAGTADEGSDTTSHDGRDTAHTKNFKTSFAGGFKYRIMGADLKKFIA